MTTQFNLPHPFAHTRLLVNQLLFCRLPFNQHPSPSPCPSPTPAPVPRARVAGGVLPAAEDDGVGAADPAVRAGEDDHHRRHAVAGAALHRMRLFQRVGALRWMHTRWMQQNVLV